MTWGKNIYKNQQEGGVISLSQSSSLNTLNICTEEKKKWDDKSHGGTKHPLVCWLPLDCDYPQGKFYEWKIFLKFKNIVEAH